MSLPSLLTELSRRRVFRALVAYGIAASAVLQIIEPIMHGLQWPDRVLSYVVVALALGFPVVVSLAWIFDVREGRIERTAAVAPASGLRGVRLVAVLLAVGLATGAPGVIYFFAVRSPAPAASAPVSIAVLPFVNMSSDKETDYFSDGMTEELINALANIDGLRVVSRTAAFALKGQNLKVQKIGARLNVATLLEGSVRREGNALRVTAQLIKVSDGYQLWSKSYDRELKSIFALEDEITRSIAQALRRKLVHGIKQPTTDLAAHDLYLKGRYFWNKRTLAGFKSAAEHFEHAIQLDPAYAIAYSGLADAIALQCEYGALPASEAIPKARAAALRALELDPGLAEAHTSLGNISMDEFEWTRAIDEFRTAIELEPDYATAHQWYAEVLARTGRLREAREEIRRAQLIDPTSLVISTVAGSISAYQRDYGRAVEEFHATLEMEPGFRYARGWLARAYALQGRYGEPLAELDKLHTNESVEVEARRAIIYAMSGRRAEALRMARELEERSAREFLPSTILSSVWAAVGDRERAFAALEKACASPSRPVGLWRLKMDPDFDPLRSDPRFHGLLTCVHLD